MNDQEINRAIAEHLGWSNVRIIQPHPHRKAKGPIIAGTPPVASQNRCVIVPNYCGDLHAMHEVEKVLTDVQCLFYPDNMREVITEYEASRRTWHATARQRAEAFLRTVGKWVEDNSTVSNP